jgi:hypothetical protein
MLALACGASSFLGTPWRAELQAQVYKPINKLCVNVIVQKDAFRDLATAKAEVQKDIDKAQAIFSALVEKCCPRIQFEFKKDEDVQEKEWTQQGNKAPGATSELLAATSQMGGWKLKKGDVPCVNIFYFKSLPPPPEGGARAVGITITGAATTCNKETIKGGKEGLRTLEKILKDAEKGNAPANQLQNLKDIIDDWKNHPFSSISVNERVPQAAGHEIGHLLGLNDVVTRGNLMAETKETIGEDLSPEQCKCLTEGKESYSKGSFPFK